MVCVVVSRLSSLAFNVHPGLPLPFHYVINVDNTRDRLLPPLIASVIDAIWITACLCN